MRKTILFIFLVIGVAACACQVKAQQVVPPTVNQTVIKALETKIAELEVRRAMDLPFYPATSKHIKILDAQINNLRIRVANLAGYTVTSKTVENRFPLQNAKIDKPKMDRMMKWTDGNKHIIY